MKIAPTLQHLVVETSAKCGPENTMTPVLRAELRALLAVARAAQECDYINGSQPGPVDSRLRKALARLDKVSR